MDIAGNLLRLQDDIRSTALNCGRDPSFIRILAVSKTFPPAFIEEACAAGQLLFGENRVQEAQNKIPRVRAENLIWHLVGHLQSNKARRAVELFDVIESVDSEKIARRIAHCCAALGKRIKVLIQINIGEEPQKSGFCPGEIKEAVDLVQQFSSLDLMGLMAIPPLHADPERSRPYFRRLAALLEEANRKRETPLRELSMGMSGDYRIAIEEGATLVRLGTAVFGARD